MADRDSLTVDSAAAASEWPALVGLTVLNIRLPMALNDVVIYTTSAYTSGFYDRAHGRAGGAERQMTLLALALAAKGVSVAHVVYPPRDPISLPSHLTLVHRKSYAGNRRLVGGPQEATRIWGALREADARVAIVRTAGPGVGLAALYCKLRRRRLIFSASSNADFTPERVPGRLGRALYELGVRLADVVVVQSDDQVVLARQALPGLRRVVRVASIVETETEARHDGNPPPAFLWIGRLVDAKQPMRYAELARALPEARFVMITVPGMSSSAGNDELRAAARDLPNLEFLDPLPHRQLSEVIARSVAIVNSSSHEGMPNVFLEAWALGVPVLTLRFDPDGVIARRGLGIAADGSWERFVAGASELWQMRGRRAELSRRTRAYVEEVHSPAAVATLWTELIRDLEVDDQAASGATLQSRSYD